jgi:branched-chain amino acid aminotransferase/4-amino-4-deoxychorismate lyase
MITVPADDRGLLLGDGLFETILAEAGRLRDWSEHMGRLHRGCAVLGLEPPGAAAAERAAAAALEAQGLERSRAAVRLTLTAGSGRGLDRPASAAPRLLASAFPAPAPQGPVRLKIVSVRRNDTSPAARLKTLSYLDNVLARRQALLEGADEALMLNTRGELACAAAGNLFWIAEDRLYTPALECGVLDGIMRARVMAAAEAIGTPAIEVRTGESALETVQAAFLTNSLIGLRPAVEIEGRSLGQHRLVEEVSRRCT